MLNLCLRWLDRLQQDGDREFYRYPVAVGG